MLARFGFMHLVATNVALWGRLIIWESANDWFNTTFELQGVVDSPIAFSLAQGPAPDPPYDQYAVIRAEESYPLQTGK